MKVKAWIGAMRLRTLPLAASCVLMGAAISCDVWKYSPNGLLIVGLTLLTTFLLQILSNLANDYGDFMHGTDNDERVGPERAMQSGAITKSEMLFGLIVTSVLTLLSGLALLLISLGSAGLFGYALLFLSIGIGAIAAAIKYTAGKNPYGYRGLGDLFVFVFFGIVGVTGTAFLLTHSWNWSYLVPATTIGLLSCAVLNLNNMRDHVNDKASGKITIVVRMGFERARIYHILLVLIATSLFAVWLIAGLDKRAEIFAIAPAAILFGHLSVVMKTNEPAKLDPQLKVVALSTFLIALIYFVVQVLYT